MGTEAKPKVEAEANTKKKFFHGKKQSTVPKFKATTPGLEEVYFKAGDGSDAVLYTTVKTTLARHIGATWTGGPTISRAIESLVEPTFNEPREPGSEASLGQIEKYKLDLRKWNQNYNEYKTNKEKAFDFILNHTETTLEDRLKALTTWKSTNTTKDVIQLLKDIRDITHKHDETRQGSMAYVEDMIALFTTYQRPTESDRDFKKRFDSLVDMINAHGGKAGFHAAMVREAQDRLCEEEGLGEYANITDQTIKDNIGDRAIRESCEEFLALLYLKQTDNQRYSQLKTTLDNSYLLDKDLYPMTREQTLKLVLNFAGNRKANIGLKGGQDGVAFMQPTEDGEAEDDDEAEEQVAFVQTGSAPSAGKKKSKANKPNMTIAPDKTDHSQHTCHNCGQKGHIAVECDQLSEDQRAALKQFLKSRQASYRERKGVDQFNVEVGTGSLDGIGFLVAEENDEFGPSVAKRETLDKFKIYLDNCATYNSFFNESLLSNIHETGVVLRGKCNAGVSSTKWKGDWNGIEVWYNPNGIANLLSMGELEKLGFLVAYHTNGEWVVTSPKGERIIFKRDTGLCDRLPYVDVRENHNALAMIQTGD